MLKALAGARNAFRNPARAILVVLVLGLSVGLFVTMLRGNATTAVEARKLKAEAGTRIQVNEAGNASGYAGAVGARELPADTSRISALPGVVRVERYVKRPFVNNRRPDAPSGVLIGVEPGAIRRLQAMGGFSGNPTLIAGREFGPQDDGKPVAIVGQVFARGRGLALGDEFVLPGEELQRGTWIYPHAIKDLRAKVVGIFRVGVVYGDNQVFVPLGIARDALGIAPDRVSQYVVTAGSAENVPQTAQALKRLLGSTADVISDDAAALQTARLLESASLNSRVGAVIAAVVGSLVVLFTMVIVTRERTREIGVLKAIGASNRDVATLFSSETLTLALLGGGLGFVTHALAGSFLAGLVIGNIGSEISRNEANGLDMAQVAWAFALTLFFGLAGSLYAVWRAVRLRPSEAMRRQ